MKLDYQEMERVARQGCGVHGCGHNHDKVYLNGQCHPGQATVAILWLVSTAPWRPVRLVPELDISCSVCRQPIVSIALAQHAVDDIPNPDNAARFELQPCHPGAGGTQTRYMRGAGELVVECRVCDAVIARLEVAGVPT